jgi:hypothetical protein
MIFTYKLLLLAQSVEYTGSVTRTLPSFFWNSGARMACFTLAC